MKNEILKDHFLRPRGMGAAPGATHRAVAKSEVCNDIVRMTARIVDGVLAEVRTEVYGCGYAIAGASLFNERAQGMSADEAARLDPGAIAGESGAVPGHHGHCVGLAHRAYLKIHEEYREGK
jgi:NifU-like protein involved in Fe-S cluster formation